MGVWLGPMIVKPKPITIYEAGDQNVFTKVAFKYTPANFSASDGVAKIPTIIYGDEYLTAQIVNNKLVSQDQVYGHNNTSGILVSEGVDISKYTKVIFNYSDFTHSHSSAPCIFYISQSNTQYEDTNIHINLLENNTNPAILDISELTGQYYIGILLFAGGDFDDSTTSVKINNITVTAK